MKWSSAIQWLCVLVVTLTASFGVVISNGRVLADTSTETSTGTSTSASPFTATFPATSTQSGADMQAGGGQGTAPSVGQSADQQLDEIPTSAIDSYWRKLQTTYGGYLPDVSSPSLIRSVLDNGGFSLHGLVKGVVKYFFSEIFDNAGLLGGILILSVLAAILESIQNGFERQAVSQVAYAVVFLVLMVLAIGSFTAAMGYAKHAIQSMTDFMLATVPLVVALLAASGAIGSAAFFHPMLLFSVHLIGNIVFLWVFPLIFFSVILDIASTLSPRYKLTRLAGLLRTIGSGTLALSLSAFIGVSAVQGAGRGIADGVALRTAKTAVSTFVPVIGKALSDAAETVASASLLVKNAVGIAGLVIVAAIALFPALKILALSFIYNGSAALMQPLGDSPMIACLGSLSKGMILVFASVAAVALMFFVAICILLASANLAVVMG